MTISPRLRQAILDQLGHDQTRYPNAGVVGRIIDPRTIQTPALDLIDQHLTELLDTPDGRLIITMPPQEGKSTRGSRDLPIWALLRNPDLRIVSASYAQGLANRNGRAVRNAILAHPELGLRIAADNGAASEWTIANRRGGVLSVGRGAGVTGRPADCIIGDTLLESEHGPIAAEEAFHGGVRRLLAFDHISGRAVWRDVEAARRITGRRVVEVRTEGGRVLTCTPDHRLYTGRGYVAARDLRPGDSLVSGMAGADHEIRTAGAPHRPGQSEQLAGEPDNGVLHLSRRAPQVGDDTVSVVLPVRGEGHDVYDFQVAGTSNFFADGLLVHNCLIIDDPLKDRAEADSEVIRDTCWDWWTDALSARLTPGAPVLVILTRWHEDDLAGRLLTQDRGYPWKVLNIPAQCEDGATDPLGRQVGEFMQSARGRTLEQWENRKATAGARTWAALYQGRPTAAEGGLIKRDWLARRYSYPLWEDRDGHNWLIGFDDVLISADLTFKGTEHSDYVAIGVWARRGADVYLLDQVRARLDFMSALRAFEQLVRLWPQAALKLVEDKANGPALMSMLGRRIPGIVPYEPRGSKQARANAWAPFAEAGNVWLPSIELAPWVDEYVEELAAFPNGAHDDQVDQTSMALDRLLVRPLADSTVYDEDDYDDYRIGY